MASTIRDILYNRAYVGEWKFKKRQWQKVPGTNTRRYRDRPANEVIQRTYPERRIIDDETWTAVQARLADVRVCYAGRHDQPKGRATGRQNNYILSGLLYCGACQAPMTIHAGTSARYYRCSDQKKRGTCANRLALREDVARRRILGAVRERYSSPASAGYMRKRFAERLGELSREVNAELSERRERLARVEEKMAGLADFIAGGERSDYITKTLHDHEAQAKQERAAIDGLVRQASKPVDLPSPDVLLERALDLEALLAADPVRGREELKRLFDNGRLLVEPQPEGHYIARGRLFPLALLSLDLTAERYKPRSFAAPGLVKTPDSNSFELWSSDGCAGRI